MAIQFSCPYCAALIQVPDSACGKMGQCPQCQTQLLVPAVEIPPLDAASIASEPALQQPVEGVPQPFISLAVKGDEATDEGSIDADIPLVNAVQPTMAQRFGRRKKNRVGILVPVTLAGVLLVVLLYVVWRQAPELTGNLRATIVQSPRLEPGLISKRLIALPDESVDRVLNDLVDAPLRIDTNVIETEIQGTRQGIAVRVQPGIQTEFFRVSTKSLPELSRFYDQHAVELALIQEKELRSSLEEFFQSWDAYSHKGIPEQVRLRYRDQVVLNALVGGLGYQLMAVVGKTTYRCVYERDGRFYFLLPPDVIQFNIVGRKHSDDTVLFPGCYTVNVLSRR